MFSGRDGRQLLLPLFTSALLKAEPHQVRLDQSLHAIRLLKATVGMSRISLLFGRTGGDDEFLRTNAIQNIFVFFVILHL